MQVTLNEKEIMWFIPGKIHLTYEKPVADLDVDTLNPIELKTLALSIKSGAVQVSDIEKVRSKLSANAPTSKVVNAPYVPNPIEARKALLAKIEEVLKSDVGSIKKVIESSTDFIQLRELLEKEKSGKARKSILTAASAKLDTLTKEVQQSVGSQSVELTNPDGDDLEVEDSDTKQVTLTIPEELAYKE